MSNRQLIIDDTDPHITYFGPGWFTDHGSQDGVGNYGDTYKTTSHGTKGSGSLIFPFSGSSVAVWGTTALVELDNGTRFDPSWECFVDNVIIGSTPPAPFPANNWRLCGPATLADGPHEVRVNVTTSGTTFWLDYITYTPSVSVSYQTAEFRVENTDLALIYSTGWGNDGNDLYTTMTSGSQAKFDFIGTSVTWVGSIPIGVIHTSAIGSYSIDKGTVVSFNLAGLPASATDSVYNQALFTAPNLTAGPHSLIVTHIGASTPLTIDYLYVTNVSLPAGADTTAMAMTSSSAVPTSTSSPTSSSVSGGIAPSPSGSSRIAVGAIVGGAVGGLALIAVLILLFWWYRRSRAARVHSTQGHFGTRTAPSAMFEPFISTDPTPGFGSTKNSNSDSGGYGSQTTQSGYTMASANRLQPIHKSQVPPALTIAVNAHQDSGIRINGPHPKVIIADVPPTYSAD
ncbi:hypothetical protein DXG01_015610 [Tephrocybe rancida]|nr:hypothetical protein DXG01_015610 [Tephrocybe rancida]